MLLFVLLPLVGVGSTFSSDEGAQILQAKAVSEQNSWSIPNAFARVDPEGEFFALEKSQRTDDGFAPLPKLITYSSILAQVDRLAGTTGMVVLSIMGTVAAAAAAATAAEMLRPGSGVVALWLTGGISPLVVDAFLVYAHTLAAACVGGAMLAMLHRLREPTCRGCLIAAPALVYFGGLLRNEAVLVGGALALAALATGVTKRSRGLIVPGLTVLVASAMAWLTDKVLQAAVLGKTGALSGQLDAVRRAGGGSADDATFLEDRWRAFVTTWIRPAYDPHPSSVALLAVLLVGVVGAGAVRRRPVDRALLLASSCAATLAAAAAWVLPHPDPSVVPGLLIAFPALLWGLALVGRSELRRPAPFFLLCAWLLSAGLVLFAQYPVGGAWEWGGRYFAAGLPLVTPLVALGLARAREALEPKDAWLVAGCFVVVVALTAAGGVNAVRRTHERTDELTASVLRAAESTEPGDGDKPIIISTQPELPRSAWRSFYEYRWLLAEPDELGSVLRRLEVQGVSQVTLATRRSSAVDDAIAPGEFEPDRPAPTGESSSWWITVLDR